MVKGGDLVKSWFAWMDHILNNFSFYMMMIVVILLLVVALYILFRCRCRRSGRNMSREDLIDIFTIMAAKNAPVQSTSSQGTGVRNKF